MLKLRDVRLTSNVQRERVALAVALGVVRGAGVHARVGPGDLLQDQASVADNHSFPRIVIQLSSLKNYFLRSQKNC